MRSAIPCGLCKHSKEGVKIYRAKYGKAKMYSACPACQENMKKTEQLLDRSHKKAVLSGKYNLKSGSLVLTPLNI